MRFANPPGISAFLAKNVGFDEIGGQGIRDHAKNELEAMDAINTAQRTGLATLAKDEAAKHRRKAMAYQAGQQANASTFGAIASGIGSLGSAAFQSGIFDNSYGGFGSTGGGLSDTVRAGDTGKYGSFSDPTADIRRAGYEITGLRM